MTTTPLFNGERFLAHTKFMAGVPDEGVVMRQFFKNRKTGGSAISAPAKQDASCGTSACVAGWLVLSDPENWYNWRGSPRLRGSTAGPSFASLFPVLEDMRDYFGISQADAAYICSPNSYSAYSLGLDPSKAEVLDRMVEVAKRYDLEITPEMLVVSA